MLETHTFLVFTNTLGLYPLLSKSPKLTNFPHTAKMPPLPPLDMLAAAAINRSTINQCFTECILGYHLVNDDPIKESVWETVNATVLNHAGYSVQARSKGSHQSGGDITCSLGGFSNKTTQYNEGNKSFKVSSYRLTTVCGEKSPGTIEEIIEEINRRKNFQFYSILVREELATDILYDWYLLPCDHPAVNPTSYTWSPMLGKIGKNKGGVTGWETNVVDGSSMNIKFSMSSQLWMNVNITDAMKEYLVASCRASRNPKYNYITLYKREQELQ